MDSTRNVGGTDRLARAALAVGLTLLSLAALRRGRRKTGLLAGLGALSFGFNATTGYCGVNDALGVDTTADAAAGPSTDFDTGSEPSGDTDEKEAAGGSDGSGSGTTPRASGQLTCAACNEPIRVGQSRGPNDDDEIVHTACASATHR